MSDSPSSRPYSEVADEMKAGWSEEARVFHAKADAYFQSRPLEIARDIAVRDAELLKGLGDE